MGLSMPSTLVLEIKLVLFQVPYQAAAQGHGVLAEAALLSLADAVWPLQHLGVRQPRGPLAPHPPQQPRQSGGRGQAEVITR